MIRLLKNSFILSHKIFPNGGTCLEFGVHVGNTFVWEAREIKQHFINSTLIGFDSWEGLPEEEKDVWFPARHNKGEFTISKDVVLMRLDKIGMKKDKRIRLIDGFFKNSLTTTLQKEIKDLIFINIDVDIYKSTIELLNFIKPLLRTGVIIYWDDWKDPQDEFEGKWGEHLAWEKWISKNDDIEAEAIEINPLNQRYMVITKAQGKTLKSLNISIKKIRYDAFEISNYDGSITFRTALDKAKRGLRKLKKIT